MDKKIVASVQARNASGSFRTELTAGSFDLVADEPLLYGGNDLGPSPADYLCMALASCQAITLRMYAQRKEWPLQDIDVHVEFVRGSDAQSGVNTFYVQIRVEGALDEPQRRRLEEIARACPVHRLLTQPAEVVTRLE